ncbi:RNA polymerase sigma factor [Bacillota bacterium Meth-B3]
MKRPIDEPSGYLGRLRPIYVRLFRTAHAIVGNLELSEYVLKSAIVEAWLRRGEWQGRMGFQDSLMHTVRTVALVELGGMRGAGAFEVDWVFPEPMLDDAAHRALLERLLRENGATQRVALLCYGADLSARQIAAVMQMRAGEVSARLRKLNSRLSRALKQGGRRGKPALEAQMEALCRAALGTPGEDVPEPGAVFRSFERDIAEARKPRASAGRVVGAVVKALLMLILAAAIWLMAVLLEPNVNRRAPRNTPPPTQSREFDTNS